MRRMRWAGHVARMGEERGVYRVFVGKPEGKRPLGWPRRRWVDNIRMDLQEVGCGYMDWIGLVQARDRRRTPVSAVMNLRVPWNSGISWLAANQLASQEGLCTMEWVSIVLKMNTLLSYMTILLIVKLLYVNWFIHDTDESLSFKWRDNFTFIRLSTRNIKMSRTDAGLLRLCHGWVAACENAKPPWRQRLDVLHNSYQDVRCPYCLIMWNKGEGSLSVVGKDLIYCHVISGPCPCKNRTVASFLFFYSFANLVKSEKLCVMLIVSVTSVVEQTGRWMDSLSHKPDYKLYGFWTALDLKGFLLGGISENCVQHRHKNIVLMKYVRGELNSCEVEYIYIYIYIYI